MFMPGIIAACVNASLAISLFFFYTPLFLTISLSVCMGVCVSVSGGATRIGLVQVADIVS